ncbi:fused isobutyryl-CoA mutase/GTPase IcmF [Priestia endophytica]|uniref:fused isobutyryl-CoA mutase/GTPase IcmF n=1 Tax=Priestia endophytica TaxID=135735 RepID=UPI0022826FF5|nr:fused isobutyryl-CoA mutase/GTPase IcmF [Priestia endophytica]MCY8231305.1 methylmalonyl-CoA mutase family protein [Priestia endophytica]
MGYKRKHHIRFITASSLFDGHDASINIMRRLLQGSGVEVIHLGHNRSVDEIVQAALQEDVQGIAVSSYQGGHMEYFMYMYDLLQEKNAGHIKIYGGGGGVILPKEIRRLHEYGISHIFSPEDGRNYGLQGMIDKIIEECDVPLESKEVRLPLNSSDDQEVARLITHVENGGELPKGTPHNDIPVIGITGTGGAGKSSLTDELIRRFLMQFPSLTIAVLSIDPTKQKTGGALLGDRIRMNAVNSPRVFMRSLATRSSNHELSFAIDDAVTVVKEAGYDIVIVETSGIGQGDASITNICDLSLYVMTSEFGAPSQLEKIEMIDYADFIVINKFDKRGSEDAKRQVQKQYQRNHALFDKDFDSLPVYGTMANQFNDSGTNILFNDLVKKLNNQYNEKFEDSGIDICQKKEQHTIIPPSRQHYMREISDTVRRYHQDKLQQAEYATNLYRLQGAEELTFNENVKEHMRELQEKEKEKLSKESLKILETWEEKTASYKGDTFSTKVRGKTITTELVTTTLSGLKVPKVMLPSYHDYGDILKWVYRENTPGFFPFTAGVFPFKRKGEDPKRQFAGEGPPERTNRRFHYLSKGESAHRLSTAFDSVTLYGEDPNIRPDIFGKIGESGVSICTLDDMKELYKGFDLCAPTTSVSMTINGPAPILLAMFLNTAIDQAIDMREKELSRKLEQEEIEELKAHTLNVVRGTVQADILKEDQGQNTCIFSTEFALRMMGDIQQYFIDQKVRNYYSVSISGYHIAEAGANPISQLAFTLANGFTYVEYYLSRGMKIDEFAPNLSFFFSNGLDAEYTVIGRVARRIWAIVMREKYGGNERSQKLKYHVQTSGRSLHAQEISFNDIRTTLQALMALHDNCNSLHTNAYDEAITTPTEESVRRAMAIQLIVTKEHGLTKNENPLQGSFIVEELTDLVEEEVLKEFERISDRGGVLGAMEMQYQRSKIQDESMFYEMKKHTGELPIIGVNTYQNPEAQSEESIDSMELARSTKEEKQKRIVDLQNFQEKYRGKAERDLEKLKEVARNGGNIFTELMNTVKTASLGQITHALYEVGGQYRRNM